MIEHLIFVLTASILIAASIKMFGAMLGNGVTMPQILPLVEIGPTHYLVMYPSLIYQVSFWTTKLDILS